MKQSLALIQKSKSKKCSATILQKHIIFRNKSITCESTVSILNILEDSFYDMEILNIENTMTLIRMSDLGFPQTLSLKFFLNLHVESNLPTLYSASP